MRENPLDQDKNQDETNGKMISNINEEGKKEILLNKT